MLGVADMVVGFAFSEDHSKVVLIRKTHPDWQAGKLNGIGGHLKTNLTTRETPSEAMVREFREEAGIEVGVSRWSRVCTLNGTDWYLAVYTVVLSEGELDRLQSDPKSDEKVDVYLTNDVCGVSGTNVINTVDHVRLLIQLSVEPSKFSFMLRAGKYESVYVR